MGTVYRSTRYFLFPSVDSTTVLYRICTLYPTLRTQTPNLTTSHSCVCYYTGFYIHTYYLKAKKNRSGDTPSTHSTSQLAVIPRRENVSTSLPIPRSTSVCLDRGEANHGFSLSGPVPWSMYLHWIMPFFWFIFMRTTRSLRHQFSLGSSLDRGSKHNQQYYNTLILSFVSFYDNPKHTHKPHSTASKAGSTYISSSSSPREPKRQWVQIQQLRQTQTNKQPKKTPLPQSWKSRQTGVILA